MTPGRKNPKSGDAPGAVYLFPGSQDSASSPAHAARLEEAARTIGSGHPGSEASAQEDRESRIRELKKQIAAGAYQPDPREIAREILKRGL